MNDVTETDTVTAEATERPPRKRRISKLGWSIIWILVLILYITYSNGFVARNRLAVAQTDLDALRAAQASLLAVIGTPGVTSVTLAPTGDGEQSMQAYWSPAGLALIGSGIPEADFAHALQLWALPESGDAVSLALFNPGTTGEVLLTVEDLPPVENPVALAISDEPSNGSDQPSTDFLWRGAVAR